MDWVTIIWCTIAAACLTVAVTHLFIWVREPTAWAHLLFACSAVGVAAIAGFELTMMRAQTPVQFGAAVRWVHLPLFVVTVSLVSFVRLFLRAGRPWLAWATIVARTLALIINFIVSPNLNYRRINGIQQIDFLGLRKISVASGDPSPWMLIAQLSSLLLLAFTVDAMIAVWRRGDRRRAVMVCGSIVLFILVAAGHSALVHWGGIRAPYLISIAYMGIIVAMGFELSSDVVRAATLANQLEANQSALRDSDQRVELAATAAGLAIWNWDLIKDEIWMSEAGNELFGFAGLKQIGFNRYLEAVHPEDRQTVTHAIANSINGDGDYECEFRVLRSGGQTSWIAGRGRVEFNDDGKPVRMRGACIDLTERKLAEDRVRQVFEAAPSAMIMINPSGEIALVNAQAENVFGYTRDELLHQPIEMLVPEAFRAAHPGYRRDYFQEPRARAMGAGRELFGRRKDGSHVPVEIGLNPVSTSLGTFALASVIDVTARKEAESQAKQQRDELAHLSRVAMLGELSGSLAHELNQPLTAILSNAEAAQQFLTSKPVDLQEIREILKDIVADDNRAGEIIRRLRLLFKKGEPQRQDLDVNDTVRDVLKLVNSDLLNHGVTVDTELDEDLPTVNADRVQVQQVLLNLVVNSCDAMAKTQPSDRRLALHTAAVNDSEIRISVTDRGCGIPNSALENVFAPFFTTKAQGMGLGLAVCRTIVTAHGGRLWATNNAERGATFHIALPCTIAERTV